MAGEREEYGFRDNIEMMHLEHMMQTRKIEESNTYGFNTDNLYNHVEQIENKEKLF